MRGNVDSWIKRAWRASVFALQVASLLFVFTAGLTIGHHVLRSVREPLPLAMSVWPLAIAALGMALVAFLVPTLLGDATMEFPLNLTLPTVYCTLVCAVSKTLSLSVPPIVLIGDWPRLDQMWADWRVLSIAWLLQCTVLSISVKLRRTTTAD